MIYLVTLDQAKRQLSFVDEQPDEVILNWVGLASGIVLDYLKIPIPAETSPPDAAILAIWPSGDVPEVVQQAVLLVAGEMSLNREASAADFISPAIASLLCRQRDPSLA
jgi:hypothetical protein